MAKSKGKLSGWVGRVWTSGSGLIADAIQDAARLFPVGDPNRELVARALAVPLYKIVRLNAAKTEESYTAIGQILAKNMRGETAGEILERLRADTPPVLSESDKEHLRGLDENRRAVIFRIVVSISWFCIGRATDRSQTVKDFAVALNLSDTVRQSIHEDVRKEQAKSYAVSYTGIICALLVILIFILTASYLSSIFFGLMLAFFLIPLQQIFNRTLFGDWYLGVLRKLDFRFRRADSEQRRTLEVGLPRRAASHSALFTFIFVILIGVTAVATLLLTSISYVNDTGRGIRSFADTVVTEEQQRRNETDSALVILDTAVVVQTDSDILLSSEYFANLLAGIVHRIDSFAERFHEYPAVQESIHRFAENISKPEQRHKIGRYIAEQVQEFLPGLLKFFGSSVRMGIDLLLSLVFCAIFMQMFAVEIAKAHARNRQMKPGAYIVESLVESDWIPDFPKSAADEAATILDNVLDKIKAWLRGYLGIILIEAPIYIVAFMLIGVPYAVPLGIVSACSLLVPVLLMTACVIVAFFLTLSIPDVRLLDFIWMGGLYLAMGYFENFVLYPRVGKKLDLTLLETLAAVLLGGYFFGLAGLLLAIPVMGVMKYLLPLIWQCWFPPRRITEAAAHSPETPPQNP